MLRLVIFHFIASTLMPVFEVLFCFFIATIFFTKHLMNLLTRESQNKQLISLNLPHYFSFFANQVEYLIGFSFHINKIGATICDHSCSKREFV